MYQAPTEHFTILKPRNPLNDEFYVVHIYRYVIILWNGKKFGRVKKEEDNWQLLLSIDQKRNESPEGKKMLLFS